LNARPMTILSGRTGYQIGWGEKMLNLDPLQLLLIAPGLLAAVTFHEYAHAAVANALGDPTPRISGRLTLNPISHIDWIGLLMLVTVGFGWAKPVQVNPYYFNDRRRGMLLVSLAGPGMNLVLALVGMVLLKVLPVGNGYGAVVLWALVQFNVILAVFNALPIPPLDGSKILLSVTSGPLALLVNQLQQYGWLVLILLLWSGVIGRVLGPMVRAVISGLDWATSFVVGF